MFDVVDVIFDFAGIITGYGVSPESRYSEQERVRDKSECGGICMST